MHWKCNVDLIALVEQKIKAESFLQTSARGCSSLAKMPIDLNDVATDDLLSEVQRRLHCFEKPEKRVIMVGKMAWIHTAR